MEASSGAQTLIPSTPARGRTLPLPGLSSTRHAAVRAWAVLCAAMSWTRRGRTAIERCSSTRKWLAEGRTASSSVVAGGRRGGVAGVWPWGTGSGAREVLLGQPAGSALGSKSVCAGVVVRRSALLSVGVFAGHAAFVLVSGSACPSWHARNTCAASRRSRGDETGHCSSAGRLRAVGDLRGLDGGSADAGRVGRAGLGWRAARRHRFLVAR